MAPLPSLSHIRSLELSCCSLYGALLREGLGDVLFGGGGGCEDVGGGEARSDGTPDLARRIFDKFVQDSCHATIQPSDGHGITSSVEGMRTMPLLELSDSSLFLNCDVRVLNLRSCIGVDDEVLTSVFSERPWASVAESDEGGCRAKGKDGPKRKISIGMSDIGRSKLTLRFKHVASLLIQRYVCGGVHDPFVKRNEPLASSSSSSSSHCSPLCLRLAKLLEDAFLEGNLNPISADPTTAAIPKPLANPLFSSLQELYLYGCMDITDRACLFGIRRLRSLRILNLFGCSEITDRGIDYLCPLPLHMHAMDGAAGGGGGGWRLAGAEVKLCEEEEEEEDEGGYHQQDDPFFSFLSSPSSRMRRVAETASKQHKYALAARLERIRKFESEEEDEHAMKQFGCSIREAYLRYPHGLCHLETLCLDSCPCVTDEGIAVLAASSPSLTKLDLNGCSDGVMDEGLLFIAAGMRNLQWLRISNCARITDVGIAFLAERLSSLWYLRISSVPRVCGVGFGGSMALAMWETEEYGLNHVKLERKVGGGGGGGEGDEHAVHCAVLPAEATMAETSLTRFMQHILATERSAAVGSYYSPSSSTHTPLPTTAAHRRSVFPRCFPSLWEIGMDHCSGLSEVGSAVIALATRDTLRELDWSYCSPGLGGGEGEGASMRNGGGGEKRRSHFFSSRVSEKKVVDLNVPSSSSDSEDGGSGDDSRNTAIVIAQSEANGNVKKAPPLSALSVIGHCMKGLKSLYLIGHTHITDAMLLDAFTVDSDTAAAEERGAMSSSGEDDFPHHYRRALKDIDLSGTGVTEEGIALLSSNARGLGSEVKILWESGDVTF